MATPQSTTLSGAPPSRMSLGAVVTGRIAAPMRVLLYGVEGVGKSSFAAGAPAPVFLAAEDGTNELDVARLPLAQDWQDVLDAVHLLQNEKHAYKTLVIDTLDWIEPMIWRFICARDSEKDIESYGYGKGYTKALQEWQFLLQRLDGLRRGGMHVVLLAHSWIKPFKNPQGEDYDRYELKLNKQAAGICKEWPDCVLFANHEVRAKLDDKTKRVRGESSGARFIYTARTAAYDAKNRYGLPKMLPLSWADFAAAAAKRHSGIARTEIEKLIEQLPEGKRPLATAALASAGDDQAALAVVRNRVHATLDLLEREKEE
jgi:hypothetical protein